MKGKMRKIISAGLIVIFAFSMTACAGKEQEEADTDTAQEAADKDEAQETEKTEDTEKPVLKFATLGSMEPTVRFVAEGLVELGYPEPEISLFDGNEMPATAVKDGDVDGALANHILWVQNFAEENNCELTMLEPYYFITPVSLYSEKYKTIEELPEGAQITIPNDPTNRDKALRMLRDAGLITLKDIAEGESYQMAIDIVDNPKNLDIVEMDIMSTGRAILETDASITTASIAAAVDVDPNVYLFRSREFREMGMFVRNESLDEEWVKDYATVINSQELKDKFNDYYKGIYVLYDEIEKIE